MPLELYTRGAIYWVKGRIDLDGRPITEYMRRSTGAPTKAGALAWIEQETQSAIRRYYIGDDTGPLTFADAVLMYDAKPAEAGFLLKVLAHIGHRPCNSLTPSEIRALGRAIYPAAAADTWQRQVITPVKAVINNAHDQGHCNPIKIRGYTADERLAQDRARGKSSRGKKTPVDRDWLARFVAAADPHNAALAQFLFETGCRITEALSLTPKDLDLQNARFWWPGAKGHDAQWVEISMGMVATLANLPPRPSKARDASKGQARIFGYTDKSGPWRRWKRICAEAGIDYRGPHSFRHGFYTELTVRRGVSSVTAAKAGRWSGPRLPDAIYAHSETAEREIRELIRTDPVQPEGQKPAKSRAKKG